MAVRSPNRRRHRRRRRGSPLLTALLSLLLVVALGAAVVMIFKSLLGNDPKPSVEVTPESSTISYTMEDESVVEAEPEPEPEPEPIPQAGAGIKVCIDAGHGGYDPGCSNGDIIESLQCLEMALAVRDAMEATGMEVVMTRDDDTFVKLEQRPVIANDAGCDYFISIHRNTLDGGHANGVEVYHARNASEQSIALAETVDRYLAEVGVTRDRGVTEANHAVTRGAAMPAILVEMGYVIDEEDNRLFYDNMDAYAEAFAHAVIETYQVAHGIIEAPADSSAEAQ